jgi:hypothetical protein
MNRSGHESQELHRYRSDLLARSHWEASRLHYEWEPPDDWFEEENKSENTVDNLEEGE